jgi:hypothetical protein
LQRFHLCGVTECCNHYERNKGQVNWVQPFKLLEFEGFFYPLIPAGESPEKGKGGVFKGRSYLGSLSPDQGVNTPP